MVGVFSCLPAVVRLSRPEDGIRGKEAGEEMDENLSKSDASKKIDELQRKTGRGLKEK